MQKVTLALDPALLSTSQQRITLFSQRRIITNPRVARGMKLVQTLVKPFVTLMANVQRNSPTEAVKLGVIFYFAYPKTGTKAEKAARREGAPVVSGKYGDLDNRQKGFQDALVKAGCFTDDRFISSLLLKKRYTLGSPRIEVLVGPDLGDHAPA